ARHVPLATFRSGVDSQPALVPLPVPAPYGKFRTIVQWKIEECLPDAVAAFVEWLVRGSGWTVTERERPAERVPLRARHVCLLFRRFRSYRTDVTHPYVRALEARHLPHLLVGGTSFHRREEVEAIRNALSAIERPEDELAVFATLRGPLFALGDAALLAFRERCRTLHSFRPLPADLRPELREVADALAVLRDLHRGRNRRPISDTIGRLLAATRAPAGIAIWPTGEQALANVSRLTDLARCAVRLAGCSPPELLDHAAEELARDREEAARVLYVAATRARDLLVVPAVGDGRQEGWLAGLNPVVYPGTSRPDSRTPPGCPAFGTDTVLARPTDVARPAAAVVPGLPRPELAQHRVVWWDPAALRLDVQESVGLAQHKLLTAAESNARAEAGIRRHDAWQATRTRVRADAGMASVRVVTATEQAAVGTSDGAAAVVVETVPGDGARPHGQRFGTLVHAILAAVDLDASPQDVAHVAALEGRLLGASADETNAATATVTRALGHPLVRRAARAASCRRETPVAIRLEDGVLVEGVVDAAFLE